MDGQSPNESIFRSPSLTMKEKNAKIGKSFNLLKASLTNLCSRSVVLFKISR